MNRHDLTLDLALDAICVKFEQALQLNNSPCIEDYVKAHPDLDDRKLITQLVLLELEYLSNRDELPTIEAYSERFPQQRAAIEALFEAVKSGTLDRTETHQPTEKPGESIGPYRLLEQIGEGGMGVVFMAEQTKPIRRKVALKIIKPGMDTGQVIARFEAERQALAMMDHANIARVLDAGSTDSGRPYFVMELVRGIPITDYCDQNKLPTGERLELFVNVSQAVQHAHTKGIIHRDIKPSNVLVTHHDGVPIPKIIDFGVAKATNQQLTERTLFTAFAQLIGTPLYMSPEQAEMSGLDVDTRSDIYSLGVLLYELLTGRTPVDKKRMQTAALDEIRRLIREEDPVKPSTAVSTLGEEAKVISLQRGTDANQLRQSLSGELDWIVMKALEKDRTRRFQTASDFAEDVQRHLAGETVEACPPTFGYRFGKIAKRYRTQVAVASTFVALLVGSTLIAWGLYARARTAARNAEAATSREQEAKQEAITARQDAIAQRDRAENSLLEVERVSGKWLQTHYVHNLSQAAVARKDNDSLEMLRLLETCDKRTRGWEWHWLNNSSRRQHALELQGDPEVVGFNLSHDGVKIAIIDANFDLRVHRFPSGELLWHTPTNVNFARYVRWSPDDTHVCVLSQLRANPGQVVVWNARTQKLVWKQDDGGRMGIIDFSPDGRHLVLGRPYRTSFEYWALDGKEPIWTEEHLMFPVCLFSPDGKRIYVAGPQTLSPGGDSNLSCYDIDSRKCLWFHQPIGAASFPVLTPDGKKLITAGPNKTIIEWDTNDGKELNRFNSENAEGCFFFRLDPTGQYLMSIHSNDRVTHDLSTGTVVARDTSDATGGQFTLDGQNMIIKYSGIPFLQVRNTIQQVKDMAMVGHERGVKSGFLSTDERTFFSASTDGTLRKWDLRNGLELNVREAHSKVYASARSTDGRYFATGGADGLKLWNATTTTVIKAWTEEDVGIINWIDFSSEGNRVAAAGKRGTVWVWESETQDQIASHKNKNVEIDGLAFCSLSGDRVAILPRNGESFDIWEVKDAQPAKRLRLQRTFGNARDVKWCPNTNSLAIGNGTHVEVWNLANETRVAVLRGHSDDVSSVAFNRDGSRIFSGSQDGELRVWDIASSQPLLAIEAHQSVLGGGDTGHRGIEAIVWSEVNQAVVTCGGDGRVKVWESTRPDAATSRRRDLVINARELVDSLRRETIGSKGTDSRVVELLKSNDLISSDLRQLAFQLASVRARRSEPPMKPQLAKPQTLVTAESFKSALSTAQQQVVDFVEAASNIPVSERMAPGQQDQVESVRWYEQLEEFVDPENLSLDAVEALVQPLIVQYPDAHHFHLILGHAYSWRRNWETAYEHFDSAIELTQPGSTLWFGQAGDLAPVAVLTGHLNRYQELCQQVVDYGFAFDDNPSKIRASTTLLSLAENSIDDIRVAEHINNSPMPSGGIKLYFISSRAMADYRRDDFAAVVKAVETLPLERFTSARLVSAMAYHKLGETEKARTLIEEIEAHILVPNFSADGKQSYSYGWHTGPYTQVIYEEAKALLDEE